jgi:vancomycin resistance protein YoaR
MRIRALVGSFTTPFACCEPRVVNIALAARILDGTVIPAGARFSLNEALGERTPERGFVPAPQINAGRLEDAVGGGVSQVATTLFNAAFFAGLRMIAHTPHEFWITRYPPGREATVSWGGPELVVQNDWPAAVLLRARATGTSLTVSMYSDPLGRRVETQTIGVPVAGAPFPVTVTRRVWAGDRLRRDERFSWSYRAPPPPS